MSEYEWKLAAPLRNVLTFTGSDGKPVLVIDGDRRRIDVSEGVTVSDAAQAVLSALRQMLLERPIEAVRDDALEEAARLADGCCTDRTDDVARGIGALKEKREPNMTGGTADAAGANDP